MKARGNLFRIMPSLNPSRYHYATWQRRQQSIFLYYLKPQSTSLELSVSCRTQPLNCHMNTSSKSNYTLDFSFYQALASGHDSLSRYPHTAMQPLCMLGNITTILLQQCPILSSNLKSTLLTTNTNILQQAIVGSQVIDTLIKI